MIDTSCPARNPSPPRLVDSRGKSPNRASIVSNNMDIEQTGWKKDRQKQEPVQQQSTNATPNANVLVRIAREKPTVSRSCCGTCGGTILKILLIYGLVATGIGGYFLRQFFRIPSLQNEVDQLSKQVDRLQVEIVNLK